MDENRDARTKVEDELALVEDERRQVQDELPDVEGHGLFVDADAYVQGRGDRDAKLERELRERQRAKEARPNRPNQR